MIFQRLYLLPGCLFLLVMATFAVTYCVAVLQEHVVPGFPYISDTGTEAPESCIFAQFINFAALLLLFFIYIRYLQLEEVTRKLGNVKLLLWCNRVAVLLGIGSCLGLDLVANFQESNVLTVHMIGAFLCFFSGSFYFCLQTFISYKVMPVVTTPLAFALRCAISTLCIVFTITTIMFGTLSMREFTGSDIKLWRPEDGGWGLHLASTISEWLLVVCFCGFIASFSCEFRSLVLKRPTLMVNYFQEEQGDPPMSLEGV